MSDYELIEKLIDLQNKVNQLPKHLKYYKGYIINVGIYQCSNCLVYPVCRYRTNKTRLSQCSYQQWLLEHIEKYRY